MTLGRKYASLPRRPVTYAWWRHQMETFSALLAISAENSPVPGEFSAQRPVTRSFDVFFDLNLNKQLSKQSRGWWFETPSGSLWRQCNGKLVNVAVVRYLYVFPRSPFLTVTTPIPHPATIGISIVGSHDRLISTAGFPYWYDGAPVHKSVC